MHGQPEIKHTENSCILNFIKLLEGHDTRQEKLLMIDTPPLTSIGVRVDATFHALTRKRKLRKMKANMVIFPQRLICGRDMAANCCFAST